jgi:splicing factor 3B subunit 3
VFALLSGIPDDKGVLIVAAATHVQKNLFFFLCQSEFGDIYKVTLTWDEDGDDASVSDIHVKYFDTIPVCSSLCVLKTGFLFAAAEFSNHYLFQFQGIGDDDDTPVTSSKSEEFVYFQPRAITNLALIDEMESLGPILDMKVADLAKEHTPQIYTVCGRGARSSLRILRHGLAVTEMAVSELPGNPNAVWAVKRHRSDDFAKYIVVSFVNWTIVLSIGETVTEVTDSNILDSTPTLSMSLLGDDSLLQIHPNGIRHIRGDNRVNEWKTPGKKQIVQSAVNERQVVIGLTGGELVYFELDGMGALPHRSALPCHHSHCSYALSFLSLLSLPLSSFLLPYIPLSPIATQPCMHSHSLFSWQAT